LIYQVVSGIVGWRLHRFSLINCIGLAVLGT
jgi:hypothetical protein